MRIGYACLTIGVDGTNIKRSRIKNITTSLLMDLIEHNLNSLSNMINYNGENEIKLFRISSDIIPFASNQVNEIKWATIFQDKLVKIGRKIKETGMRVSMHPGQYTVLNSPDPAIVERAIADLEYHALFLDSLQVGIENKIVLHIGGVYNNKELSKERFIERYRKLDLAIKNRLVIENDDKSYNVADVLEISAVTGLPVVYDRLHDEVNPADTIKSYTDWIEQSSKTWAAVDGSPKIHYSQQEPFKRAGTHSQTIDLDQFGIFFDTLKNNVDIMLEVKDKNISATKCLQYLEDTGRIKRSRS